jgi:DNA-binding NtrC family response regulator
MPIRTAVVADDEILNRELLSEILPRFGVVVRTAKDGVQALKALEAEPADLLISDIRMPGMGGIKLLLKAREKWPTMPVVMMTAFATVESAVESMRQGAYDYLMKPFGVDQVEALLLRLNERHELVREVKQLRAEVRDRHQARKMLGNSPAMLPVLAMIERAARASSTVLVNGESGTGKELVARALHERSPRADGPFVKVNCAALTETLLTSELFGHEKGAFTGADAQHAGRFETADGGTLLLDEISEISAELQAKLLRVLEEREFERVGGSKPIQVDVRIVATTNRNLQAEVQAGRFREDLFYRLNVVPITLPALRERREDIPAIVRHYFARFTHDSGFKGTLGDDAVAVLSSHQWPGNVRELVNVVERLVVLHGDDAIDAATVRRCVPGLAAAEPVVADASVIAFGGDLTMEDLERRHLLATLDAVGGDKQRAADRLGIAVRTLWSKLAKYRGEIEATG